MSSAAGGTAVRMSLTHAVFIASDCPTVRKRIVPASTSRTMLSQESRFVRARSRFSGSGNAAVHIMPTSSRSIQSLISLGFGVRNGSSSRYRSRLGTWRSSGPSSSSGYGCPENTST